MEPRQGQVGAKRGQQGQDRAKMRPICGQEGPRWGQEESKIGQDGAKTRPRGGQKGALKPARKTLKKRSPGSLRFGPQNGVRNLDFSSQKIRFSEQTRFQKTNPQKTNKERPRPGAILLPSVAPEGTPPAMLLKKLAFGTRTHQSRLRKEARARARAKARARTGAIAKEVQHTCTHRSRLRKEARARARAKARARARGRAEEDQHTSTQAATKVLVG